MCVLQEFHTYSYHVVSYATLRIGVIHKLRRPYMHFTVMLSFFSQSRYWTARILQSSENLLESDLETKYSCI